MLPALIAAAFYLAAGTRIWLRVGGKTDARDRPTQALAAVAAAAHATHIHSLLYTAAGINLALGNIISAVACITVILFLLAALRKPIAGLGLLVLPWGLAGLLVGWQLPGAAFYLADLPSGIGRHIAIAIPAYGVLSIAFAQAVVLHLQEKHLRRAWMPGARLGGLFAALPALQTMETTLFQLTALGFVLLSVNLATGIAATQQHYGAPLLFNHHILLAILAWAGFGGLLLGRRIFGWRGRLATRWTIAAFGVLALAYFGTRFVTEVILTRGV